MMLSLLTLRRLGALVLLAVTADSVDAQRRGRDPDLRRWDVEVNGHVRRALIAEPRTQRGRRGDASRPVVFVFHGHGGRAEGMTRGMAIHRHWPEAIVVYPQGLPTPGLFDKEGRGTGWQHDGGDLADRDLRFFDVMLEELVRERGADPRRVHVTGHSNGGGFCYVLMVERGHLLASAVPSSASATQHVGDDPLPPIPLLHSGSPQDRVIKWRSQMVAIERAKELYSAGYANVQPHSGSQANAAVYFSVLEPGDKILTMDLSHGGHLTHGHFVNFSGKLYEVEHYGVSEETETIDYDALAEAAKRCQPKMITAGASAYSQIIDFSRMREIADSVGAYLFVDMAHISGLVAGGVHPSPIEHADFVTTTTHKSLRGHRGGLILTNDGDLAKKIDSLVFPGVQGGPLMHVIAAKAVCFLEALQPDYKKYQFQIVKNAVALAERMKSHGYRIISGGTQNHLFMIDLRPNGLNGKIVQETLDEAGITVNKNSIPFDTESPFKGGGIRIGTPAVTTRGMKEAEMEIIGDLIHEAIANREDAAKLEAIRVKVKALNEGFPLP